MSAELVFARCEFNAGDQTNGPDVDDVGQSAQRVNRLLPLNSKFCAAREEHLLDVNFECGKAGCATDRMTRTRVTMEQLD